MLRYNRASMVPYFTANIVVSLFTYGLGCSLIIARSFARIHETNLKVRLLDLVHRHQRILIWAFRNKEFFHYGLQINKTTRVSAVAILSKPLDSRLS